LRGNVVDLAIVADIIMPIIGAVTGGLDFSNYYVPLSSKVERGLAYTDARSRGRHWATVSS
jgi:large conductance mechanosensitive channel